MEKADIVAVFEMEAEAVAEPPDFALFALRHKMENLHIYLWILKDYAWSSGDANLAWAAGTVAILWLLALIGFALKMKDAEEAYMLCATLLWLCANCLWMAGEVDMFGDDATNTAQSGAVFVVACAWLAAYYLWLKPRGVLKTLPAATLYYDNLGLRPRSCFGSRFDFANFRDYEHLHTVFWVLKDMFWNRMWVTPWVVAFACTFGVGFDFVFLARRQPLECAVYTSQLLWVTANFAWASGEFFVPQHDEPIRLNRIDHEAAVTGRWWAQLLLVFAMIPGILCYGIYVPFFHGKCRQNEKIAEAVRLSPMHDVAAMT